VSGVQAADHLAGGQVQSGVTAHRGHLGRYGPAPGPGSSPQRRPPRHAPAGEIEADDVVDTTIDVEDTCPALSGSGSGRWRKPMAIQIPAR
jgi:hypothetical protein